MGEYEEGGVASRASSGSPVTLPDSAAAREREVDLWKVFGERGRRYAKEGGMGGWRDDAQSLCFCAFLTPSIVHS